MAHGDPKLQDFGAVRKVYDFKGGVFTNAPADEIPDNMGVQADNMVGDRHGVCSKVFGTLDLITGGTLEAYNRFILPPVWSVYPYTLPTNQPKLVIQGVDASDGYMSLYELDRQDSYPASVSSAPSRILGANAELSLRRQCSYATYKGRMYVWNGADALRYWEGNGTVWKIYHDDMGERFKYLTVYSSRLWAAHSSANPSRVIYTNQNYCNFSHYFSTSNTNYLDFHSYEDYSPITAIKAFQNGLLVFKVNSIYRIDGDPETGINFNCVSHGIGTVHPGSVQVWNNVCYFAWKDGIYVYGDTNVTATGEDRRLQTVPNVIRVSTEIDDYWRDNIQTNLPQPDKVQELTYSGYQDLCSTLSFTTGTDASDFKASDVGLEEGDWINGATSGAVGRVAYVDLASGGWHAGTAAGTLYLTQNYSKLAFDSGGTTELQAGWKITGATSGATAWVWKIVLTGGTWAGGDAAGYMYINRVTGTWQNNENVNVDAVSNIATIDGTIGTWTNGENIRLGSKVYAVAAAASAFDQKWTSYYMRLNRPPNSTNPDVMNMSFYTDEATTSQVPHTSERSNTSQDSVVSLRSLDGENSWFSQSLKLNTSEVDLAICSGVELWLKEIGDVSGDEVKVYICGDDDGEPDFNDIYAEGHLTGNFLHGLSRLTFNSGSEEPLIGVTITENGGDGTGIVHRVVKTSGAWSDGDAVGIIYIKSKAGTWSNGSTIDITGGTANVATVTTGDAVAITTGTMIFCEMDYWDYPQNLYDGDLTDPPTCYIAVKVTGDDDANYLQWGYIATGFSDGQMVNSDPETPSGQSGLDYTFNLYCRRFIYSTYATMESDTIDGGTDLTYWKNIFIVTDNSALHNYTRNSRIEKIEYETKPADSGWDWDNATEIDNGGSIGDATNLATNRYLRIRAYFARPGGAAAHKMDSITITKFRIGYSTQTETQSLVSSAIHEGRYIFSSELADAAGAYGDCLYFNATNDDDADYVSVADSSTLDPGTGDFAFVFDVKCIAGDQIEAIPYLLSKQTSYLSGSDEGIWGFSWKASDGTMYVDIGRAASASTTFSSSPNTATLGDGSWHTVVVSYDRDGNLSIYVDGVDKSGSTKSLASFTAYDVASSLPLYIGTNFPTDVGAATAQKPFIGYIDNVQFYKRTIDATEALWLYNNQGSTYSTTNLQMHLKMSEGYGVHTLDETANNNDGSLGGTGHTSYRLPTWSAR